MARIPPIHPDEAPPAIAEAFARHVTDHQARITNMKATLGHSTTAFAAYMQWYPLYEEVRAIVGHRLAYLYAYAVSEAAECPLCTTFFRKIIMDAGERPEAFEVTPDEQHLLHFGASMARHKGHVEDALFAPLRARYTHPQLVVLIAFAGIMMATNVFNNAVQTDIDGYLADYLPATSQAQ